MKLSDFDYKLPKEWIAIEPIKPRDHSRLLLLNKNTGEIEHKHFYNLFDYLQRGDVLVLNNSKVFPARLIGHKKTGGQVEVFLHQKLKPTPTPLQGVELWNCILGGRIREGILIKFDKNLVGKILKNNNDGTWEVEFNKTGNDFMKLVEKMGKVPIPPYIEKQRNPQRYLKPDRVSDTQDYQTVYADDKKVGSVAAPTAGFHFTPKLLKKIKEKGVQIEYVTLHVGLGTFAPVKTDNIKKHKMHAESVEIKRETIARLYLAKSENRRIIAVGTTSLRSLEAIVSQFPISNFQFPNKSQISNINFKKQFLNFKQSVNIFIYPGYKFKIVDAMITNFHLPKSTLLMLVSALAGQDKIKKAYQEAIDKKYRFYSYGDAMFIY